MPNNCPEGEKKLFLVRTQSTPAPKPNRVSDRLLDLIADPLIPLALIFCGMFFLAASLWLQDDSLEARDFLLIFLPPLCVLLGAASANRLRR